MELLLIESDSSRRINIAKHFCRSGHRITLVSSIAEAQELLGFVRGESACLAAVLISEALLGQHSAIFRTELRARFPALAWVPVRSDLDLDWLRDWVEKTTKAPKITRRCLDILFIEEDRRVRQEVTRRLSALGDRVVSCPSIARARTMSGTAAGFDVLIAPTMVGGSDTISLFLSVKKGRPNLRWIVSAERAVAKPPRCTPRSTYSEVDQVRRSAKGSVWPDAPQTM